MELAVDNAADNEFKTCDDCTAYKTSYPQTFIPELVINNVNQQKSKSARQKHRPMRISACNYFNKSVYNTAETENGKILSEFNFNQYYHR